MPTRREFLRSSALAGLASVWPGATPRVALQAPCEPDPLAGAQPLGIVRLGGTGAGDVPFHRLLGSGLDARLFTDLADLSPDRLATPTDRFYVRTAYPDLLEPRADWSIRIHGLVRSERRISIADLRAQAEPQGTHLLECAGNNDPGNFGLMSVASWTGVRLDRLLERAAVLPGATRVLVAGFDRHSQVSRTSLPGASWIFTLDEISTTGAFLALEMNGEPLPRDHGCPVRLIVPGWYGCAAIKWVDEIALVDDAAPATTQMREFAARTHQARAFDLARDYEAAAIDVAATPIRIERWRARAGLVYRVVGIIWGGQRPVDMLEIRFNATEPYYPVPLCPPRRDHRIWSLWTHDWRPPSPGIYHISLRVPDSSIRTRRLDLRYYTRSVRIDEV